MQKSVTIQIVNSNWSYSLETLNPSENRRFFGPFSNIFIQENAIENVVCEIASILSRPQCVKTW